MKYADHTGNSNITDVDVGADFVVVTFKDGSKYRYTIESCGENAIVAMKEYATRGSGLNGFISRNRPPYESKE